MKKSFWIFAVTVIIFSSCSSDSSSPDITKLFVGSWTYNFENQCVGVEPTLGDQSLEITKTGKGKIELTFELAFEGTATFNADVTSNDFAVINANGYIGTIEVVDGDLEISLTKSTCTSGGTAIKN